MSQGFMELQLRQMEESLRPWGELRERRPPHAGWIRAIREALGMSAAQLGRRLGVSRQAVSELERREAAGGVTLAALQEAARALDAELVYAIVPRVPLSRAIEDRALLVARRRLDRVAHSMRLEDQAVHPDELARQVTALQSRLVRERPRWLWDDAGDRAAGSA